MDELFGKTLRAARKHAEKTLGDLARALGVSVSYVSDVERGYRPPWSKEKIIQVAEYLAVDPKPLVEAAAKVRGAVSLDMNLSARHLAVGASLARRWSELSDEDLAHIEREVLNKYGKNEG